MKWANQIAAAFAVVAFIVPLTGAQMGNFNMFKHPLTDMPDEAEDVDTAHYFPDHPDHKFPIGQVVTALCHFSNEGASYYNVSAIMGSLNSPFDFRHHFQNYSYKPVGTVVKAGEEITLKYAFQLHAELEPVDYQLAITVFYDSEAGETFSTTFFNQTVELYFPTTEYDFETVTSVLYSIVSSIVVVLLAFTLCFPNIKLPIVSALFDNKKLFDTLSGATSGGGTSTAGRNGTRKSAPATSTDDDGDDADDEWLKDQPVKRSGRKTPKKKL